jgi:cardiolipin synthase
MENYCKRENREQARTIIATWSAETVASKVQQLEHLDNNVFRSHRVDGALLARMEFDELMNVGLTRSEASTIHHDLVSLKIPWWKPIVDELNTIPNMITCSRMVATPFLGYIILQEEYTMACVGLAIFGFSDWLDGYIARTYNQTSVLGTFLDPFADKMLIMTLTGVCGYGGLLPLPLVGLILARDASLIVGGFYLRGTTKPKDVPFFDTTQTSALEVKPSNLSKFNTASQVGLLMGALTNAACGFPGDDVVLGLCWLTGCTTFGSGLDYYINRPINAVDPASKQKGSSVDD